MNQAINHEWVTEENKRQYRERGYFITPPLFDAEFLRKVSEEFDAFWEAEIRRTKGSHWDAPNGGAPFMTYVASRNAMFAEIFRHPSMLSIAHAMIGPNADLCYDQIVMKQPHAEGGTPQYNYAFHQDTYYALSGGGEDWNRDIYLDDSQTFQGWMAFTPTTLENGTLFVVPGAHKHGLLNHIDDGDGGIGFDAANDPRVDFTQKIPVLLEPGQLLVFSGLLPHGSGINRSSSARKILQFSIARTGGRPPEHVYPVLVDGEAAQ